jgi:hypothetical protein
MKVYICKQCGKSHHRREDLRPHLFWHGINDTDVDAHFTQEERQGVAPPPPVAEREKSKGMFGWLRRSKAS